MKANLSALAMNSKLRWAGMSIGAVALVAACASNTSGDDAQSGSDAVTIGGLPDDSRYALPADYQSETAEQKQADLWKRITRTAYTRETRIGWPGSMVRNGAINIFLSGLQLPTTFLRQSFETDSDEQPLLALGFRRRKAVHNLGCAVEVELQPEADSPYTGLFQGGVGIARLSLAAPPKQPLFDGTIMHLTPGLAMKLLVDGKPSVNLHAMPGVDGIDGSDFFARPFTNAISKPQTAATKGVGALFQAAISPAPADHLSIEGFAKVDRHGNTPDAPKAPAQIFLKAIGPASHLENQDAPGQDFRDSLEMLGQGPLFEVFALAEGDVITEPADVDAAFAANKLQKIATVVATSFVVDGDYEDNRLFFNHQKVTE